MALQGATPALVAAFSFGIVVNAATAALFLYISGHGSAIFRDGLRLVLITFLLSAALWAQISFIATTIEATDNTMPCQVGIIFSTLFDQVGRFSAEQYLLWAMSTGGKLSIPDMMAQVLVVVRFVIGMVFVGFSRPQVDTVCVTSSSNMPVAIVVIALDFLLIALFAVRAFMTRMLADVQEGTSSAARSKSVLLVIVGFTVWTGTSVAMLLGMPQVDLIARTAVPAGGLSILILIVTACTETLPTPRKSRSRPPEAPSPRHINISRDISSSESNDWPPTRYEDLKEQAIRSSTTFLQPREAPRVAEEKSEVAAITGPVTRGIGVGGMPVQGELFPPMRTETTITSGSARKVGLGALSNKRGLLNFGKGGPDKAGTGVALTIGNPILQANDPQNPLNKIPTMDLQEAARAERERRAMALKRESDLIAKRPAPQPPSGTPEDGLRRAVSVKRKEVASVASQGTLTAQNLDPQPQEWAASTTSAQVSPGVEDIRRRSPRQPSQEFQERPVESRPESPAAVEPERVPAPEALPELVAERASDWGSEIEAKTAPEVPEPKQSAPAAQQPQTVVRTTIRPSRQPPASPKAPAPEAPKTQLQKRPTIGLPGNPRARGMKLVKEAGEQTQQTVMFVNSIVYDDPTAVKNIIDGANDKASKKQPVGPTLGRSSSVVNRPRPIPRKASDHLSQDMSKHRRSRSGGSIISRKSILMSNAGSPTQLPPLPPPPKSAGVGIPGRPHPNNTKSMTVDEKMTLFFPSPPNGSMKKTAMVPIVPPIPSYFRESSNLSENYHQPSNRSTRTSIKTDDVLSVDEITPKDPYNTKGYSPEDFPGMSDNARSSWLPDSPTDDFRRTRGSDVSSEGIAAKRASSPVLPPRASAWTETTDSRTHDDDTTNWDALRSPEVAVGVQVVRRVAKATDIGKSRPSDERGSEEVAFMLDPSVQEGTGARGPRHSDDESMPKSNRASQGWHRRVGDECPTFSARAEKARSRKMPPPTPLLLNSRASKSMVVVQAAEPSPLESPQHAIEQVKAQLAKLDKPNRDSIESQSRRLALLENLEKEMGMQEDLWHEMQHDIGRDSLTSLRTSPSREARRESLVLDNIVAAEARSRTSIAVDRRASRRARMRTGTVSKPAEDPVAAADNARVSVWQQRLAEAQNEYMETIVADRQRHSNVNFLAASVAQLGSPTPPESDESDGEIRAPKARLDAVATHSLRGHRDHKSLWVPKASRPVRPASRLWAPGTRDAKENYAAELPGISVRIAPRKETAPLQIHSTQLWSKPHNTKTRATGGLWRPTWAAPQPSAEPQRTSRPGSQGQPQKAPRPVTQRPPRRNKRVTLLPDIVENPEPLPDKRGTLGIFQFPWGERSDTASVQPARMVMAMPGTMTSGGLLSNPVFDARSRQLEATEYSSSFFDDYDDDEGDQQERDSDDFEGDDSEDDFDENTLWEIANLLKTDDVPSKFSLLPPRRSNSVVDDYINEIPSDDEAGDSRRHSIVIGLADVPADSSRQSVLWNQPLEPRKGDHGKGLPEPDDETWQGYCGNVKTLRTKPRKLEPAVIESNSLWSPSPSGTSEGSSKSPIWVTKDPKSTKIPRPKIRENTGKPRQQLRGMWTPQSKPGASDRHQHGLFSVDRPRSDYRTTTATPAARDMVRKPRASTNELPPPARINPASSTMWTRSPGGSPKARFEKLSHGLWSHPPAPKHEPGHGSFLFVVNRHINRRTTALEPAAKTMARQSKKAARPSEPLTWFSPSSTTLWSPKSSDHPEKNWITTTTSTIPLRRHFRPALAYNADWDAALQEALVASYPIAGPTGVIRAATKQEWNAALGEALALGWERQQEQEGYTVAGEEDNPAIRAQIEELERERMFAEQVAREAVMAQTGGWEAGETQPVRQWEQEVALQQWGYGQQVEQVEYQHQHWQQQEVVAPQQWGYVQQQEMEGMQWQQQQQQQQQQWEQMPQWSQVQQQWLGMQQQVTEVQQVEPAVQQWQEVRQQQPQQWEHVQQEEVVVPLRSARLPEEDEAAWSAPTAAAGYGTDGPVAEGTASRVVLRY